VCVGRVTRPQLQQFNPAGVVGVNLLVETAAFLRLATQASITEVAERCCRRPRGFDGERKML
jgi:hypothetical protein